MYDPFAAGPYSVATRSIEAHDAARNRTFAIELWHPQTPPAKNEARPLVLYSHPSGGNRRAANFLTTHLASHGYVVAALDHSETFAPELAPKPDETPEQKKARAQTWIANRVPDLRFLLDSILNDASLARELAIDANRIGLAGHSFGGWTVLQTVEEDPRIRAVVAMAPGGNSNPKPGILALTLNFDWHHDVPALYLAGDSDTSIPLEGAIELLERTPSAKRLAVLRGADHLHFMDDVELKHEAVRTMVFPPELAWIPQQMRPIAELCSGENAHLFTRGLALAHFDAALRELPAAQRFWRGDIDAELAARGIDGFIYNP
jgi:predicted dienelactone hydrolase